MNEPADAPGPRFASPSRAWLWAVRLFAAAALALSSYLLLASYRGGAAGCSGDGGCGALLASRWSRWFALPVAAPAVGAYFAVLIATFQLQRNTRATWSVLAVIAIAIAGSAIWFIGLQAFVLHRVCPYCMAAHGCGLTLSALILGRLFASRNRSGENDPARFSAGWLARLGILGAATFAVLIAGQWLAQPVASVIAFEKTSIRIEREAFPSLGKKGAARFAAVFVDYTCEHCRELHHVVADVLARHPGGFEVVVLPLPLDADCNRNLRKTASPHEHACELARLALAVWRADPGRFPEIDAWLFASGMPATPANARRHAVSLIGEERLQRAEADPAVGATIQRSIEAFTRAGGRQLPVLLLAGQTLVGPIGQLPNARELIEGWLGLASP